jgi:hypothetical protein
MFAINLKKTHTLEITESRRSIFIPKEYKNYEDFKRNYLGTSFVTKLLVERLQMLLTYKNLPKCKKEERSEIYQDIISNQIALKGNT